MSDCSRADGGVGVIIKKKKLSVDGHQCRIARVSNAAWISVVMVICDVLEMEGKEEKDGWSEGRRASWQTPVEFKPVTFYIRWTTGANSKPGGGSEGTTKFWWVEQD